MNILDKQIDFRRVNEKFGIDAACTRLYEEIFSTLAAKCHRMGFWSSPDNLQRIALCGGLIWMKLYAVGPRHLVEWMLRQDAVSLRVRKHIVWFYENLDGPVIESITMRFTISEYLENQLETFKSVVGSSIFKEGWAEGDIAKFVGIDAKDITCDPPELWRREYDRLAEKELDSLVRSRGFTPGMSDDFDGNVLSFHPHMAADYDGDMIYRPYAFLPSDQDRLTIPKIPDLVIHRVDYFTKNKGETMEKNFNERDIMSMISRYNIGVQKLNAIDPACEFEPIEQSDNRVLPDTELVKAFLEDADERLRDEVTKLKAAIDLFNVRLAERKKDAIEKRSLFHASVWAQSFSYLKATYGPIVANAIHKKADGDVAAEIDMTVVTPLLESILTRILSQVMTDYPSFLPAGSTSIDKAIESRIKYVKQLIDADFEKELI